MKRILIATALLAASPAIAQVHVDGHVRKDGTYVPPHYRSNPDRSYNNNYGTAPNTNPYTGHTGGNQPTWNDRPPSTNDFGSTYGSRRRY
jgi:hypothetical protein